MIERQASRIALACALLAAITVAAFWPHYFGPLLLQGKAAPLPLMHVHAALVSAWLLLLVTQPLLIARRRFHWHRSLGRIAWLLAPAIVLSALLLAVDMTRPAPGGQVAAFRYGLLFLQVGIALLFGAWVAVALARRHDRALHARAMLAAGLTFVDPVFARVFSAWAPEGSWLWNYGSMVVAALCMLIAIALDRRAPRGRWIFVALLIAFAAICGGSLTIDRLDAWRALVDRL